MLNLSRESQEHIHSLKVTHLNGFHELCLVKFFQHLVSGIEISTVNTIQ
jgi:hypothetical protein